MATKMPRAERRTQLLDAAMEIVAKRGPDALTMGSLAEHGGVSKPIVYDHFRTRSGLLIALYRRIDARQVNMLEEALTRAPRGLADVARVVSTAYMNCFKTVGPEWHAISAALKGDEEMDAVQQETVDGYVTVYCKIFGPYSPLAPQELRLRCVGIIGAAEAISNNMIRGRTSEAEAVASLAALIVNGIALPSQA